VTIGGRAGVQACSAPISRRTGMLSAKTCHCASWLPRTSANQAAGISHLDTSMNRELAEHSICD
jgi:hypothetical protein